MEEKPLIYISSIFIHSHQRIEVEFNVAIKINGEDTLSICRCAKGPTIFNTMCEVLTQKSDGHAEIFNYVTINKGKNESPATGKNE